MASAILTVLSPKVFTVYDVRACQQIKPIEDFTKLGNCENFAKVWDGCIRYVAAIYAALLQDLSLRDKDRVLWA